MKISAFKHEAFSILELLAVIGIISLCSVMVIAAVSSIGGGTSITKAGGDVASLLEQARTHAMAQNTYVWVGFRQDDMDTLSAAVVASRNGEPQPIVTDAAASPSDVIQLGGIQRFKNVRMVVAPSGTGRATVGASAQLAGLITPIIRFGAGKGGNHRDFTNQVVQFNNRGEAKIASGSFQKIVEIGLQASANGSVRDPNNYAAVQLGALTGSVTVFRP